jgi:HSP20 family protein
MAIRTVWSPVNEFVTLRDAMDRLVSDSFISPRSMFTSLGSGSALPANLFETPDAFVVQVALPGVDPEKVQITVQGEVLNLKAERVAPQFERSQQIWSGVGFGAFEQSFSLPTAVEGNSAEASYENGMLTLKLPKMQSARSHTIKVTAGNAATRPVLEQGASK